MKTNNTPAAIISAYNLEALAQTNGTHEITVNTSKEFYTLHDYLVFTLGWDCYEYAHVSQDGSVTINIRVNNNQPEPTNPDNTPTTTNANETTYKVTITNEDYTDTKHNAILTGFASVEAASNAAKEAARDIAGELTNTKIIHAEPINAFVVVNPHSGTWLISVRVEEDNTPAQPATKSITVKRSEWNETAKRLECSGWYYIGTPTATGKTIYRRGNSELEIIIEEDSPAPEFSELSHAGQCLDIYLHNTREIYDCYTVPAIERVTRALKAGEYVSDNAEQLTKDIQEITPAISAAADLVRKYDHLTPAAQDIEQVTRNYAAYIVDCAKYEIEK